MKRAIQLLSIFWMLTNVVHASTVTEDTYMYIKWKFVSAGNNCGGYPGKVAELYSFASAPSTPPPSYMCCDEAFDPNACTSVGGTKTGMPSHEACASATPVPPPAQFDMTLFKNPGAGTQNYPDNSFYNGADPGTQIYMTAGTTLSGIRVLTGFNNNQGASCPGLSGGYCYGGSYKDVAFDTSAAKCDQWVDTVYSWCAWSSAVVSVKFKPTGGCAVPPTPTPAAGSPAPPPPATCDASVGGEGRVCSADTDCCNGNVCRVAGNQPYRNNRNCTGASCTVGVNFTSGYTGVSPAPVGGSAQTVPQKVCVPSAQVPTGGNDMMPPLAVQSKIDKSLISYQSSYLTCMLDAADRHRDGGMGSNSCMCASGYTPKIIPTGDFNNITYHLKRDGSPFERVWAKAVDVMAENRKVAKSARNALDFLTPNAHAYYACPSAPPTSYDPFNPFPAQYCTPGSINGSGCSATGRCVCNESGSAYSCVSAPAPDPVPDDPAPVPTATAAATATPTGSAAPGVTPKMIYSDQNPVLWKAAAGQNYGVSGTGNGAANITGSTMVACVKSCPSGAHVKTTDYNSCACDDTSLIYNPATQSCDPGCQGGSYLPPGATSCVCPTGYSMQADKTCRPNAASLKEYFPEATSKYLVCGTDRLPRVYSGKSNLQVSSGVPRFSTSVHSPFTDKDYPYAYIDTGTGLPHYYYEQYTHCACVGHTVSAAPDQIDTDVPASKFYPDDYGAVLTASNAGNPNAKLAPVAIAKDGTSDGRLGVNYGSGKSICGCPNVNEEMVVPGNGIEGAYCRPKITGNKVIFGKTFDPVADAWTVLDPGTEVQNTANQIVSTISLAAAGTDTVANNLYHRGIWKCQAGYSPSGGTCIFDKTKHPCSVDSPVSMAVSGMTATERFANTRNKKIACCLNQYDARDTTASGFLKFDCIDNSIQKYADFNDLWKSTDDAADGGQMNAFALTNSNGKEITGFYTADGQRCNNFSEFATEAIQPGIVNPAVVTGNGKKANGSSSPDAFESRGGVIEKPAGAAYSYMASKLQYGHAPTSPADRRRCPILVRAATVVSCPSNAPDPAPAKSYIDRDASNKIIGRRCAVASNVQVQIRVEQVWEIAGQNPSQPIDTVVDAKNASSISIDRIVADKYGSRCPPGTTKQGDACVY